MFRLLLKVAIIVLATFFATSMPEYINSNVSGFVPSEELVSRNLRTDVASFGSQVSVFNIENDISTEDLNSGSNSKVDELNNDQADKAYDTKSEGDFGDMSGGANEDNNPTISTSNLQKDSNPEPSLDTTSTSAGTLKVIIPTLTTVDKITIDGEETSFVGFNED